ncbi:hypothetical protein AB0C10_02390 [Microbispora amethystogenes]|uniref:Uncharacterized protein n=1 Tax=Microbispora amethystogenes TaxID=1427754 RepID=A0ABQ4F7S0_9ACTN|nr:hypothetical protein [Microbispora amethystogenes]GIH30872.1 hypothetical protein Mam01_10360 [Microbispora amethystogenes]
MKSIKRAAAVLATTAVAVTTFGVLSAPAQAMQPEGWYRCYVPGYGTMWCLDV